MRPIYAFLAVVAVCAVPTLASEPGQPLDCSDWIFVEPGLTASNYEPHGTPDFPWKIVATERTTFDASGRRITAARVDGLYQAHCPGADPSTALRIAALDGDSETVIAYLPPRCGLDFASYDYALNDNSLWGYGASFCPEIGSGSSVLFASSTCVSFNPAAGRLYVEFLGIRRNPTYGDSSGHFTCEIVGFATQADVIQSFTPQPGQLGFRVPYMPEGMGGADHFDTYWGTLTHPIDFTQAQGLQCDYPAAQPHVGDYLTVADTLPTPAPGTGYYYVTSATYQGQTRYGRKTTAERQSGRDPALLPTCSIEP